MALQYDFFVSYSREDKDRVRPLVDALRQQGYRLFFDVESITVGEKWKQRLDSSIRSSRALVLCWSQQARRSEYVQFEYSKAEGLGKKVLPWLLDETPLPAMVEIQGIVSADPAAAALALRAKLGWSLSRRHIVVTSTGVFGGLGGLATWRMWPRPPEPVFEFAGEITDAANHPLAGVQISVEQRTAISDAHGRFLISFVGPTPPYLRLQLQKPGYVEERVNAPTEGLFRFSMRRER